MTDRVKGLAVVLDRDYRDDDVQVIVDAIKMIKGVLNVNPSITTGEDWMNRSKITLDVQRRLVDLAKSLTEEQKGD